MRNNLQPEWILIKKRKFGHAEKLQRRKCPEKKPCEDTMRRQPSARQEERPQKKANLLTP